MYTFSNPSVSLTTTFSAVGSTYVAPPTVNKLQEALEALDSDVASLDLSVDLRDPSVFHLVTRLMAVSSKLEAKIYG